MDVKQRRIAAFLVDSSLVFGAALMMHPVVAEWVPDIRSWPLASLPAILWMGTDASRGSSPGKRLFGLRIRFADGVPGIGKGIARELIRFLSLPIFVLPVLYIVTWGQTGSPPYDRFLGLSVDDARAS